MKILLDGEIRWTPSWNLYRDETIKFPNTPQLSFPMSWICGDEIPTISVKETPSKGLSRVEAMELEIRGNESRVSGVAHLGKVKDVKIVSGEPELSGRTQRM